MIVMQYRVVVSCDTCKRTVKKSHTGMPPGSTVPLDWIQATPPGESAQKEFCSQECLAAYENPIKPWLADDEEDEAYAENFVEVAGPAKKGKA